MTTVSQANFNISIEDGWTQVATNPAYVYVRCNHNSPWYLYVSASAPSLVAAQASGTLTFTGLPVADETFVVGATTYTFKADASGAANTIKIGADATATAANVVSAINAAAGGSGVVYGAGTTANASAAASSLAGVVTLQARSPGTAGNSVVLTEALTNATVSGSGTLTGGTDPTVGIRMAENTGDARVPYEHTGAMTAGVYVRTMSQYDVTFGVIRDQ